MLPHASDLAAETALFQHTVNDPFVRQAVRRKAASLAGRYGYSLSDRDDLEQELLLDLLRRVHKFNPFRTLWEAFVATQLRLKAHTLIRTALRRQKRRCLSLSAAAACNTERSLAPPWELAAPSASDSEQLATDVQAVVKQLTPEQQGICHALSQMTAPEAGRHLGLTRKALRYRLAALRARFVALGMAPEKISSVRGHQACARRIDKENLARSA